MGIRSKISRLTAAIRKAYFRLNEKQRNSIAGSFEKLSVGSMAPVAIKFMSDGETGDTPAIFIWLLCAILFQVMAVAAYAAKDDENDN